jgi:hypothetical protein
MRDISGRSFSVERARRPGQTDLWHNLFFRGWYFVDSAIRASKAADQPSRKVQTVRRVPTRGREIVALHPRRDPMAPGSEIPTPRTETLKELATVVICYGGREFVARPSMAEVFLRNARKVLDSGHSELVPLLHEGGVELLLVSRGVAIRVTSRDEVLQ